MHTCDVNVICNNFGHPSEKSCISFSLLYELKAYFQKCVLRQLLNRFLKDFEFYEGRSIAWPGGKIPVDEPECGYYGEHCIKPTGKTLTSIVELFYVRVHDYETALVTKKKK